MKSSLIFLFLIDFPWITLPLRVFKKKLKILFAALEEMPFKGFFACC